MFTWQWFPKKQPGRIPDLLAYDTLIIEVHMEYSGDAWLGYDRRFRQCAVTDNTKIWAIIDPTLWNLAFSGKARATRCKFCFSLCHGSSDCAWATDQPTSCSSTSSRYFLSPNTHLLSLEQPSASRMSILQLHVQAHLHLLQQGSIHHRQTPPGCILSSSPSCQQCSPSSTPCITPAANVPAPYVLYIFKTIVVKLTYVT